MSVKVNIKELILSFQVEHLILSRSGVSFILNFKYLKTQSHQRTDANTVSSYTGKGDIKPFQR